MRPIFRKELREHFKVALVGLAVFGVMLSLAFSRCTNLVDGSAAYGGGFGNDESPQPLLSTNLLTQAAFFCAAFGMLLGWLQIRAEKHPDLWAFLVHRPAPRDTILAGKVLSGLLLYAAGAGVPFLGLVLVAATPGHVAAPFEWAMALPSLAIFLAGISFYFAGLLTGIRAARWSGSRTFGLGPAIVALLPAFGVNEFWQALLFIVIAQALLAVAVWGSFRTGGHYANQPIVSKLALLLSCTVSVAVLLGLLAGGAMSLFMSRSDYSYTYYQLTKDGQVLKIIQHGMGEATITDLNGSPVLDEITGQKLLLKDLTRRYGIGLSARSKVADDESGRAGYSNSGRFFHPWALFDKTIWYLTTDGRLVAYHVFNRKQVGSLAPPPDPGETEGRFLPPPPYSYRSPHETLTALPTGRTVYAVDLEKPEAKPLFTTSADNSIIGFAQMVSRLSPSSSNLVLVLSRASIHLLNFEGQPKLEVPFQPPPSQYSTISVQFLETGGYGVRFDPDHQVNRKLGGVLRSHIKWVDANGAVSRTMELPNAPEVNRDNLWEQLTVVLVPPVIPVYPVWTDYRVAHGMRILLVVVCAVFGWWLGRRNNLPRSALISWGLFHLLFGVPGFLAFLAVKEWPPKEPCSSCRRLRVMNLRACPHCGSEVPPPPKTGIEIFEPLEVK
jgi:hypothetical protein